MWSNFYLCNTCVHIVCNLFRTTFQILERPLSTLQLTHSETYIFPCGQICAVHCHTYNTVTCSVGILVSQLLPYRLHEDGKVNESDNCKLSSQRPRSDHGVVLESALTYILPSWQYYENMVPKMYAPVLQTNYNLKIQGDSFLVNFQ